jgi:hypothetical protein
MPESAWNSVSEAYKGVAESYACLVECYSIIEGIPRAVEEAARPHLDKADLNVELAKAWANTSKQYADEAAAAVLKARVLSMRQPVCCN